MYNVNLNLVATCKTNMGQIKKKTSSKKVQDFLQTHLENKSKNIKFCTGKLSKKQFQYGIC